MTLQQAVYLARKDDLYGAEDQQDKLIVLPLQPDETQGRWYAVIEDWNKQEYVALYAHQFSDHLLYYLDNNVRASIQNMASHHLTSNNWRVMTRQQFVRFNKEGDSYDT